MSLLYYTILLSLFAGSAAFAGALYGRFENLKPNWSSCEIRHSIIALGGGALLAAVALVLVPEGNERQPVWLSSLTFLLGAVFFMMIDRALKKSGTNASQLMALLLDYIPESIVLGAIIAMDFRKAVFLAVIIAVQNFPEGHNAYREIMKGKQHALCKHVLRVMGLIALSGPVFALIGFYGFEHDSMALGALMTFCAGGILYVVFRDIAPDAKVEKEWLPSLGAIFGFAIGMIGHALV